MGWWLLSGVFGVLLACDFVLCQYYSQSSWLRQPPGSMRRGPAHPGWASARGVPVLSRQSTTPSWRPVSVKCLEDLMVVTIQKNLYGNGKLVKSADLTLGTEQCKPTSEDKDTVLFQVNLQDCGAIVQTNADFLLYTTSVSYKPSSSQNIPITRTNSANIGVQCYYPRHGNVSSNAIRPTWIPYSTTVTMEERLSFALNLMNDDWSGLRDSTVFSLGDSLHIEASVNMENHVPMRIFVDSCVALLAPDPNSNPQYEFINNFGCLVDGEQEDSSSTFISQRPEPNRLRFEIDAFRFTDNQSTIYIQCVLKAVALNQTPDPTSKACSFSKTSNSWSPVEGAANICSCCATRNCDGQPRRGDSQSRRTKPGSRRHWKRNQAEELSEEEIHAQLLGPIWIIFPEDDVSSQNGKALAVHADAEQKVEPWMVAAVGGLWVVVLVGALLTWKLRSRTNVPNVQQ